MEENKNFMYAVGKDNLVHLAEKDKSECNCGVEIKQVIEDDEMINYYWCFPCGILDD